MTQPRIHYLVIDNASCKRRTDLPASSNWNEVTGNVCRRIAGRQPYQPVRQVPDDQASPKTNPKTSRDDRP